MQQVTVPEIFAQIPNYFNKGAADREMSIYFSIGDEPSGKWTVFVGPERVEVKPGKAVENATLMLKTSPEIFIKIIMNGYAPGPMDFIRGKIKSNNPTGLLALKKVFRFPGG